MLGFFDDVIPRLNMILQSNEKSKWEITMIGSDRKGEYVDDKDIYVAVWDCRLTPIDNGPRVEKGNVLQFGGSVSK